MASNRTSAMLEGLKSYLETQMASRILSWKGENPGQDLPDIAEYDIGYKDVLVGLRAYPAILVVSDGWSSYDSYTTEYSVSCCLAYKCDDPSQLEAYGEALMDCLEDSIRSDNTLGGLCLDIGDVKAVTNVVSGIFMAALDFTVQIDRGGTYGA